MNISTIELNEVKLIELGIYPIIFTEHFQESMQYNLDVEIIETFNLIMSSIESRLSNIINDNDNPENTGEPMFEYVPDNQ